MTSKGRPFLPVGVTYYRPGTGWAPRVWEKFDPELTRQDFRRMKELGLNCVRVFLSYQAFCTNAGTVNPGGLKEFDQFLSLAEGAGIYVHPTGLDHWEGLPNWKARVEEEEDVRARELFWKVFAARYRGRNVIFAYDLKNEPAVGWDNPALKRKWNQWLRDKYSTAPALKKAWGRSWPVDLGNVAVPSSANALRDPELCDYQAFRESVADEWTRRQAESIHSADPEALVTVGFIQWSVPALLPGDVRHYAAFRPDRQAKYLDFLEIHFYPLARGAYEYQGEEAEVANLAYLESVVREVALTGKPVVLAEFGWYGGGKPRFDGGKHALGTEEQQARYCRRVVDISARYVTGWLNWGLYDDPEATDCSELSGLFTADGKLKEWGRTFHELARKYTSSPRAGAEAAASRPRLDWAACVTSTAAAAEFQEAYRRAFESARPGGPN